MEKLPVEILSHIFHYLTFADRKSLCLVNKRIYAVSLSEDLWKNIRFVLTTNNKIIIDKLLNWNYFDKLTNLKLVAISIQPYELSSILTSCNCRLQHLSLNICSNLFHDIHQFGRYFHNSTIDADVKKCLTHLLSLDLQGNSELTDVFINQLLSHTHNLVCLTLSELSWQPILMIWKWPKYWHHLDWSISHPRMYGDIWSHIEPSNDQLTFGNLSVCIRELSNTLRQLDLSSTPVGYNELMTLINIPELMLEKIQLENCKFLDFDILHKFLNRFQESLTEINILNTIQISFNCPVNFYRLILLRTLSIKLRGCCNENLKLFRTISAKNSLLTYVHLEVFFIDDFCVNCFNIMPNLTNLKLIGCKFKLIESPDLIGPNLIELDLSKSYGFNKYFLKSIFRLHTLHNLILDWIKFDKDLLHDIHDFPPMKYLDLLSVNGAKQINIGHFIDLLDSCKNLSKLRIQTIGLVDDLFLKNIRHLGCQLKELNLSGASVTDGNLIEFLSGCFKLRKLRLDNCPLITDFCVTKLGVACPFLQDVSVRNCDLVTNELNLSYYDGLFLHEWLYSMTNFNQNTVS